MTEESEASPSSHYRRRLEELDERFARLRDLEEKVAWARLATFAIFVVLAWLAFVSERISGWWSLLALAGFIVLIAVHSRLSARRDRVERRAEFNRRGLARIERRWDESIEGGGRLVSNDHPYAADLDLFGPASIFALISACRTMAGESVLGKWLSEPASRSEIALRRESMRELEPRVDLRESVGMLGSAAGVSRVDLNSFQNQKSTGRWSPLLRPSMILLAILNFSTLFGWLFLGWTSI
ncbi:MAG: hypothetical protein R3338_02250, partial [Thermoanaerobaculia bacterium]|nr:hypothetical protein [Thermoanaerobaculia bacterium]